MEGGNGWLYLVGLVVMGLGGILTVVFTGARQWVTTWFAVRARRMAEYEYRNGLSLLVEFKTTMLALKDLPFAHRGLLVVGRNGGGMPKPGEAYRVTAEDGWSNKPGYDVLEAYSGDLFTDRHFMATLLSIIELGKVVALTDDMPEDSTLKSLLLEEGAKTTISYFLHCDETRLVYLTVASYTGQFTVPEQLAIERQVSRLKAQLSRL